MKVPQQAPQLSELLKSVQSVERLAAIFSAQMGPTHGDKYRHWETLRRIEPPVGMTTQEHWLAIKMARQSSRREIPSFSGKEGKVFWYCTPDVLLRMQHDLDRRASGTVGVTGAPIARDQGQRFVQRSLIEEAITSSQLEGAATTRSVAKEMIRSGRDPRNVSERMILNNYRAMLEVRQLLDQDLSIALIEELHAILTSETHTEKVSYRQPGDGTKVYDNSTGNVLFEPPLANESKQRLQSLCEFANQSVPDVFMHPAVKAIIIHFWFAYIHPFEDGNGRTARALFYWYVLKQGFWLLEFVSISRILKKAPAKYGKAFLYTETDDNDLTYFILAQLKVILRSIDDLEAYISTKSRELSDISAYLRPSIGLNYRQIALLTHALRHPSQHYTFLSHKTSQGVTYQTARTDLLDLVDRELLDKRKSGRTFIFVPVRNLGEKIREMSGR